jgi:hypothetical protein
MLCIIYFIILMITEYAEHALPNLPVVVGELFTTISFSPPMRKLTVLNFRKVNQVHRKSLQVGLRSAYKVAGNSSGS